MGGRILAVLAIILLASAAFALSGMVAIPEEVCSSITCGPTESALRQIIGKDCDGFMDNISYGSFPVIFLPGNLSTHNIDAFYPNEDHTGYLDAQQVKSGISTGGTFADLNGDGHLDYVCCNEESDSQIYWGNGSGTWSDENTTNLTTEAFTHAQVGDFNNDGEMDIIFSDNCSIFLNQGGGRFNSRPDINLPSKNLGDQTIGDPPGDLNWDGYDDVLVVERRATTNWVRCYFGGPDGPDTVPDINYSMGHQGRAYLDDIDRDGNLDIILGGNVDGQANVYLGSPYGPDNRSDYDLSIPGTIQRVSVGDINWDGYYDLAFSFYESSSIMGIRIFKGGELGWSDANWYDILGTSADVTCLEVMHVNDDPYEDILAAVRGDYLLVFFGGNEWPTKPAIKKGTRAASFQMAVAAQRRVPVPATRPSPPLNLTATGQDGSVLLEWERPEDTGGVQLLRYVIHRGPSPDALVPRYVVGFNELNYVDRYCVNGRTYYYAVLAENFKEESPLSNIASATPLGLPTAPENLTATPGCGTVLLEWDPPLDAGGLPIAGYMLHRGTTTLNIGDLVGLENVTEFWDDSVENGRKYYYRLRAINSLGEGPFSPVISTMPVGPPDPPWNLQVAEGDGMVTISWRAPLRDGGSTVTGYLLSRVPAEGAFVEPLSLDAFTTSYIDTGVSNGMTYSYRIRARNLVGNSSWSETIEVTPCGLPGRPENLTAIGGDGRVTLSWDVPGDNGGVPIELYYVYIGLDEGSLEVDTPVPFTFHTFHGLTNGETYYFKVSAKNPKGEGPPTEVVSAIPVSLPGPPMSLALLSGRGSLELTWDPPEDTGGMPITAYRVYREYSPDILTEPIEWDSSIRIYYDDQVEDHVTYYYSVSAVTVAGEGPRTGVVSGIPLGPPSAPTLFQASAGDGRVDLAWAAPESDGGFMILGYAVRRGVTSTDLVVIKRLGIEFVYTDLDVENGETYYYSVLAENLDGEGNLSEIKRATPVGGPGVPRNVAAKASGRTVTLTWEAPTDDGGLPITCYVVLRGTSVDDLRVLTQEESEFMVKDDEVERGRTYYYCVFARNGIGDGERSGIASVDVDKREEPEKITGPWLILMAILAVTVFISAGIAISEPFKYRWGLMAAPLFSRLSKEEVLDNKTRLAIHGTIVENPGIHYSEIIREFDLSNGAAAYHLNVLVRENFIHSVNDGHLKRFYAKHTKVPRDHQMTPVEVRSEIMTIVSTHPGISQKDIVDELGRDRATVGYHLREMVDDGRLEASRKGQYTIYHPKR